MAEQIIYSTERDFYMSPRAIVWTLNALGDKNHVSVSVYANAKLTVYKKGYIDYNPDNNYREWTITGYNTHFDDDLSHYVHLKISTSTNEALLIYPTARLDLFGRGITDDASAYLSASEQQKSADPDYWYLYLGKIIVNNSNEREWADKAISGELDTDAYRATQMDDLYLSKIKEDTARDIINFEKGLRIGDVLLEFDKQNNGLHISHGVYSDDYVSAFGSRSTSGDNDSDLVIDLLRDWGEYTTDEVERERALSAYLGNKLKSELSGIDTKVNDFDKQVDGLADAVGKLNKRLDDLDLDSLGLTKERLGHWDDAYSWGNHADVGYAKEKDVKSVADRLDDMFTKVTLKDGTSAIRANYGLFSVDFISAYGVQTDNGLDTEGDMFVRSITFSGGKLHVHYGKVGVNAEIIETIDNKIDAVNKRIDGLNLDSLGLTAERIGHWDSAYNFIESISGTTPDAVINTWEEIKNFVQGLDGSSTLEQILATKFDKNDFTKENILGTVGSLYWADIVVSDKSSTQTTPTFKSVKIGSVTISEEDGHLLIDKGLVSKDFISAFGLNSEQGGGGADLSPDAWTNSSEFANNLALSANLGWSLHTDIENLKTKATNVSYRASVTSGTTLGTISIDGKDNTIFAPSITSSAIKTALGYTPFDNASFTKANIKSTLGIAEWALAANAPTCVTSFGTKTGAVTVRGGQTANGSVNLSMSKNELQASIVGLGGAAYKGETYYTIANSAITGATKCKITYDSKGLVTSGNDLSESDIPNLGISKIKNLQTTLDTKLDKTTFNDLFEKKEISSGVFAIRAKYSMYSEGFISAFGINSEQSGGADLSPDTWTSIGDFTSDIALSANLGWSLHADVENLKVHCNADTVDGFHFARKTQSEYNSMTKDSKTVYFIVG